MLEWGGVAITRYEWRARVCGYFVGENDARLTEAKHCITSIIYAKSCRKFLKLASCTKNCTLGKYIHAILKEHEVCAHYKKR
mmetsp:Transcript_58891/g.87471  ORF Transcript_58891/g.87471 Transcript_58891/m.87471 type:complete len:82 (-) Transcript_58891:60-305(-)